MRVIEIKVLERILKEIEGSRLGDWQEVNTAFAVLRAEINRIDDNRGK
jgi:hypothetical protein